MKAIKGFAIALGLMCLVEILIRFFPSPSLSPLPSLDLRSQLHEHHIVQDGEGCSIHPDLTKGNDSTQQVMSPQTFSCIPKQSRIVLLGGSTVQGYGVSPKENLQAHLSTLTSSTYDVVNLGAAGYTSSQIVDMLPEVWSLQPDLLVLYTGHNDVIFYPEIQSLFESQETKIGVWRKLRKSRIFQWLEKALLPRETLSLTFNQRLKSVYDESTDIPKTSEDILESHHKAVFHESNILELLKFNINKIIDEAQKRNIDVILVSPVHNLKAPILGGLYATSMTTEDIQTFESCLTLISHPQPLKSKLWKTCLALNPTYGPLVYQHGKMMLNQKSQQTAIERIKLARVHTPAIYQGHFPERWVSDLKTIQQNHHTGWVNLFKEWNNHPNYRNLDPYFIDSIHVSSIGHKHLANLIWSEIQLLDN